MTGLAMLLLTERERLRKGPEALMDFMVLAETEDFKTYPMGAVCDYFCEQNGVPAGNGWFEQVMDYEKQVLSGRR